jgi:peroxiredoxin
MYPHERSLVTKMEKRPFALIGVNSDPKDKVKAAIARENISWRSFWDGGNTQGPIAKAWKVKGWPTLYLIDHQGVIREMWLGSPGPDVLDAAIEELVKKAEAEAKK